MAAISFIALFGLICGASLLDTLQCASSLWAPLFNLGLIFICGIGLAGTAWVRDRSKTPAAYWSLSRYRAAWAGFALLLCATATKAISAYACGKSLYYIPVTALAVAIFFLFIVYRTRPPR